MADKTGATPKIKAGQPVVNTYHKDEIGRFIFDLSYFFGQPPGPEIPFVILAVRLACSILTDNVTTGVLSKAIRDKIEKESLLFTRVGSVRNWDDTVTQFTETVQMPIPFVNWNLMDLPKNALYIGTKYEDHPERENCARYLIEVLFTKKEIGTHLTDDAELGDFVRNMFNVIYQLGQECMITGRTQLRLLNLAARNTKITDSEFGLLVRKFFSNQKQR